MAFIIKDSGGTDYEQHPSGVFPARCIRIIDLGTQDESFEGKAKKLRKLVFFFETSELLTEGDFAGQPFMLNREFTASLGEKATLRKSLESWRGRKFTEQEVAGFDINAVLGKPLMLNVVEYKRQNGKSGTKIDSMMPLPSGMVANKAVGEVFFFNLYDDEGNVKPLDTEAYKKLSEFWQKKIALSPEYKQATSGAGESQQSNSGDDPGSDDIPF
jgi:hypothetical protein